MAFSAHSCRKTMEEIWAAEARDVNNPLIPAGDRPQIYKQPRRAWGKGQLTETDPLGSISNQKDTFTIHNTLRGTLFPAQLFDHKAALSYQASRGLAAALLCRPGTGPGPAGDSADAPRVVKLLCCGGLAGAVSRTVTAPVDRLKFLMQVHTASHLTVRQGLALMANEKTVKSYFRGNGANVIKNVPETAMKLTANDRIKALVVRDGHNITLSERLTVGAVAGAVSQAVIYPLEVIQTRLAATHGVYRGIFDVVQTIWRKEGGLAFYRGMTPCLIGILPYASLDITSFELMKDRLTEHFGGLPPPHVLLGCGMLSSSIGGLIAYPAGFIRTRMQMDGTRQRYKGMVDCLQQVVRTEGWKGLYKGFGMSLAKIAPAAGISWFIFEESKAWLNCGDVTVDNHR